MNRTVVCAAVALALATTASAGAQANCAEEPGDVVIDGGTLRVDEPHLDLLGFSVLRTRREVIATFYTTGGPGDGEWKMYFEFGKKHEFTAIARRGAGLPHSVVQDPRTFPEPPFEASISTRTANGSPTRRLRGVTGEVTDTGVVTIRLPLSEVGTAAPRYGARGRVTWAVGRHAPAPGIRYADDYSCYP